MKRAVRERDLFSTLSSRITLTDAQRLAWLRLSRSENIGPRSFRDLLNFYGSASNALEALPALSRRGGKQSLRIMTVEEAEREMDRAMRHATRFVALGEADYPQNLRTIASPPPLIGLRGNVGVLSRPMVALVGSRNASHAGLRMAEILASDLGALGYVTVSGLARGIDAAIHRHSLRTGTIAVMAGGPDVIYPAEHAPLAADIVESGLCVTEMPMGHAPRAKDFPRRNRIIAGLAVATVVVEAAERSGSLITARMALEENREVLAVPGSPLDPRAGGTNRLIKEGAKLVTCVEDITSELQHRTIDQDTSKRFDDNVADDVFDPPDPGEDERARILTMIAPTPVDLDDLARLAEVPIYRVRIIILELELAGRIHRDRADRVSLAMGDLQT